MVTAIVDDTTKALEDVMDKLWILWVARLIPKVAHQVSVEAEARAWEEQSRKL